eukprot:CAMPEP_0175039014 /NCGR_PEP_ID=MMETSP0052_2-20121109/267_1 /TAXON_ID=51329 ORGANISM="Polytomella parva, Strain SAG 63-3" /NCGR_SAMPLE_ID=MMETSP0052_2 /ASSEMBLY_ACC=CAM_ASM_000194 /LENGTH=140 /DNA_ID=CAMNT_0016300657 /DNA_START=52 /DNA_END=475 /DNA_ORIENTATION=-
MLELLLLLRDKAAEDDLVLRRLKLCFTDPLRVDETVLLPSLPPAPNKALEMEIEVAAVFADDDIDTDEESGKISDELLLIRLLSMIDADDPMIPLLMPLAPIGPLEVAAVAAVAAAVPEGAPLLLLLLLSSSKDEEAVGA